MDDDEDDTACLLSGEGGGDGDGDGDGEGTDSTESFLDCLPLGARTSDVSFFDDDCALISVVFCDCTQD